jgi:hypothetical protein
MLVRGPKGYIEGTNAAAAIRPRGAVILPAGGQATPGVELSHAVGAGLVLISCAASRSR